MVNRMRHTRGKTRRKRSHEGVDAPALTNDNNVPHLRHRASMTTGMYRGRRVMDVTENLKDTDTSEKATS